MISMQCGICRQLSRYCSSTLCTALHHCRPDADLAGDLPLWQYSHCRQPLWQYSHNRQPLWQYSHYSQLSRYCSSTLCTALHHCRPDAELAGDLPRPKHAPKPYLPYLPYLPTCPQCQGPCPQGPVREEQGKVQQGGGGR